MDKFKIIVIAALVVLTIAIGGSTFFVIQMINKQPSTEASVPKDYEPKLEIIDLGDSILTNVTPEGSRQHFAKIQVSIGVDSNDSKAYEALSAVITAKEKSIRNEIIETIGEQTYSMLYEAGGKEKLADEIVTRLNTLLDTDLIYEVYYGEYFIQ